MKKTHDRMRKALVACLRALRGVGAVECAGAILILCGILLLVGSAWALIAAGVMTLLKAFELEGSS